ncbi:MAG: ATP-binding protein [Tissierellia bacterium]|nr:ATP-binding protein [Tissierellia bacterium]
MKLHRDIQREYEAIRDQRTREREERIKRAHGAIPQLKQLEEDIQNFGAQACMSVLSTGDSERAQRGQRELEEMEAYRRSLLVGAGYPPDYLDYQPQCPYCQDTGVTEEGRCLCYQQKLAQRLHKMSGIERLLERENFENFDLERFSPEPFQGEKRSPRENMEQILATAHSFIENFPQDNGENLLLYGPTGLGKTFLSSAIAGELLSRNHLVVYETIFGLIHILEEKVFGERGNGENHLKYNILFEADLLIIDDLGTETVNSFTTSQLFNVINTRLVKGKKTIISTNLTPSTISATYSDRLFSRIFQSYIPIRFYGKDLRWE